MKEIKNECGCRFIVRTYDQTIRSDVSGTLCPDHSAMAMNCTPKISVGYEVLEGELTPAGVDFVESREKNPPKNFREETGSYW